MSDTAEPLHDYGIWTEAQFKVLYEALPDAFIVTNGEGTLLLVNQQAEKLFGYEHGEGYLAMLAAVQPAETDYVFFVRTEGGRHAFSRTLTEHNRAVAAYRSLR